MHSEGVFVDVLGVAFLCFEGECSSLAVHLDLDVGLLDARELCG
jgi:hypothetical protein